MSFRQKISRDYTKLRQETRPTSDSDREKLRENSTGRIVISAIMLFFMALLAAYASLFVTGELRKPGASNFTLVIVGIILVFIVFVAALLVFGIVRGYRAIRAPTKTVYMGQVTGTGVHGGSARNSIRRYVVYLDQVMFEISKSEQERLKQGMEAEIHCVIPGEMIDLCVRTEDGSWPSVRDKASENQGSGIREFFKLIWHFIF